MSDGLDGADVAGSNSTGFFLPHAKKVNAMEKTSNRNKKD